ncbi:hypothetical protein [Paraliomyxa miuraensis]|uniref:hypothetical protein n=1 Tax=Paraliomyxa miuraensis TaxID=376150 RepID=UPI002252BA90|nr:hypothetical protein [Paraliomyxa miuraensis]MCX4245275.1 hypothetical protein [Paraliomyxa miuraensis]
MHREALVVLVGGLLACEGSASSTTQDPSNPTGAGTEAGDEAHEPASECATAPVCSADALCEVTSCGGKTAAFNHFGCARTTCEADVDCMPTESCYPRAMGASCLPSSETCNEDDGSCGCVVTQDCSGVLGAHCLPTEFYPVDGYCDVGAFTCDTMAEWQAGLRAALAHHEGAGRAELVERLSSCSVTVADARSACGESPCALLCGLSECEGTDASACVAACEGSPLDATELQASILALAARGAPSCVCEICESGSACEATWGC